MDTDIKLSLMVGNDIPCEELALIAHSPTVKEIALMGEGHFFMAMQYLCIDKSMLAQDETLLSNLSNFQVLVKVLEHPDNKEKKKDISSLLALIFPRYQVALMPRSINLMDNDRVIMIDESNFDLFQDFIKELLCVTSIFQGNHIVYNPKGKRAKEIAEKIMKSRQKISKQKNVKESGASILTRYLSILRIGPRIPLPESIEYNLFQLFDQIERYNAYVEWDTDLQVRLAGGKPDKQVETWMRNLYSMK